MSQQKKIAVLEGNAEVGRQIADRLREDGFEVCTVTDNGGKGSSASKRKNRIS